MPRRTLWLLGLTLLAAGTAAAQAGPRARMRPGAGIEGILRMRERLELTQDQVTRLRAMREAALAARVNTVTELMRLRSEARAGELSRDELRARLRTQRDSLRTRMDALGPERVRDLLTEEQRRKLTEARREAMRGEMRMRMRMRMQLEPRRPLQRQFRLPPEDWERGLERPRRRGEL